MVAVTQRFDGRFDDVLRGAKVGLADAEIDDVLALLRQRSCAGQNGKGILLAEAIEGGHGLEHFVGPTGSVAHSVFLKA